MSKEKRSHKKKAKTADIVPPAPPPPDFTIIPEIGYRYTFTDKELIELGRCMWRESGVIARLETELGSIKADFKSKIEAAEMRHNDAGRKQSEGFEMRVASGLVEFNTPTRGEKSIYFHVPEAPGGKGAFIRTEPMTPTDLQREMRFEGTTEVKTGQPLGSVGEALEKAKKDGAIIDAEITESGPKLLGGPTNSTDDHPEHGEENPKVE